jgi:hypothetical protein
MLPSPINPNLISFSPNVCSAVIGVGTGYKLCYLPFIFATPILYMNLFISIVTQRIVYFKQSSRENPFILYDEDVVFSSGSLLRPLQVARPLH